MIIDPFILCTVIGVVFSFGIVVGAIIFEMGEDAADCDLKKIREEAQRGNPRDRQRLPDH